MESVGCQLRERGLSVFSEGCRLRVIGVGWE